MRFLRPAAVLLLALAALLLASQSEHASAGSPDQDSGSGRAGPAPAAADIGASGGENARALLAPPLKIGALLPFTGDLAGFGPAVMNGVTLAAKHINDAGGVLGQPIEIIAADTATSPAQAVAEADRLINVEGVSAIVGAMSSGVTIPVAESVTIPSQIVLMSPSSTSPEITGIVDDDYLFRTVASDASQGAVLGELATEQGFATACTMYINNPYGQGLSTAFTQEFEALGGQVLAAVPHEGEQPTYLAELNVCTQGNPDVLAAMSYSMDAQVYLVEAIVHGLVDDFLLTDGTKSQEMVDAVEAVVGAGALDGTLGTAPAGVTSEVFDSEYEAEYGEPPPLPFIGEAYSAVAALALAAETAGSTDPTAIRDALRQVTNPPGTPVAAGSAGIAEALQFVRDGADINYLGHSGVLDLDFDANGDITTAVVEVWTVRNSQIASVRFEYLGPGGPECGGLPATIAGANGDDLLVGTPGSDVIVGLGGNDVILGGGGDDLICAGPGDDVVAAGGGNDRVLGEDGMDIILGADGFDVVLGGPGPDFLLGGPGFDVCAGGPDSDAALGCEITFGVP